MDRGLATVITLVSGVVLSIAQACSGGDSRPPVSKELGFAPVPGAGVANDGGSTTQIGASAKIGTSGDAIPQ